jgi:hypothetical protein
MLNKISYFNPTRSHHPKSIMYWVTEGIIIDDKRYPIEEFRLKGDDLYAVVSKDDKEYFEVFINKYDDTEILSQLEELKTRITAEEQKDDKNMTYTAGKGLILSGTTFSIDNTMLEIYNNALVDHAEIIQARGGQSNLDTRLDGLDAKDADLQSQINTNKTSITTTGSRIDNLIANAGDGTVPSELIDMRVGADGKVRGTAGNAMREQFQAVNMAATSSYDVFFTNGIMPSISILQDYSIKVSFPKGRNAYTRLNAFGRDGKKWQSYGRMALPKIAENLHFLRVIRFLVGAHCYGIYHPILC